MPNDNSGVFVIFESKLPDVQFEPAPGQINHQFLRSLNDFLHTHTRIGTQSLISLQPDLRQEINGDFTFIWCLNGTFP